MERNVALLPSVQREEGLDGYVEGECMRIVAEIASEMLLEIGGYEVELFWPGFERGPELPVLRRQQEKAEMWLRARHGPPERKVALNLGAHAGRDPRVLAAHSAGHRLSRLLASYVAGGVARAMRTRSVRVAPWDAADPRHALQAGQPFPAAHVACGGRWSARAVRLLSDEPEVVAGGIVSGLRRYYAALGTPAPRPGVVWRPGRLEVAGSGAISRAAPSRSGRVLRPVGPAVLVTDGYTEGGQRVAGSSRWYHLARECGYGWVHSSAGRYVESCQPSAISYQPSRRKPKADS